MKLPLSSVAFYTSMLMVFSMRRAAAVAAIGMTFMLGGLANLPAQGPRPPEGGAEGGGPGPGPRPPKSGMDGRDRDRDGRSGFGRGGDRDRMDAFRTMTDEERQRVRDAFEKAWQNPAVTAARERYQKANDEYRETLQKALKEADPVAVELLEKHKPKGGPFGMMPMPDPNDPEFVKKAVNRLGMELHALSRAENRRFPTKEIAEKVQADPAVKAGIEALEKAAPAGRLEAWGKLVSTLQEVARKEMPVQEGGWRPGPGPGGPPGPPPFDDRRPEKRSEPGPDSGPGPGPGGK